MYGKYSHRIAKFPVRTHVLRARLVGLQLFFFAVLCGRCVCNLRTNIKRDREARITSSTKREGGGGMQVVEIQPPEKEDVIILNKKKTNWATGHPLCQWRFSEVSGPLNCDVSLLTSFHCFVNINIPYL